MDSLRRKSASRRGSLSRQAVIEAGLAIVTSEGLARLTMRRLADHLSVEAMSLYNHVRDKHDLLDGIASLVLARIQPPDPALPWATKLEAIFYDLYDALAANPWLVAVLTSEGIEPTGEEVLAGIDIIIGILEEAGLEPAQRVNAFRGMLALCFGLVMAHTLGLRSSPSDALAHFAEWDPTRWRNAGPHLAALAPQFLITKPGDDVRFMLDAYLAALGTLRKH